MIEIGAITPPSVQLLPAKRYTGAPIGTSYDIRVYTGKVNLKTRFSEMGKVDHFLGRDILEKLLFLNPKIT
jgi:hypothetical protein